MHPKQRTMFQTKSQLQRENINMIIFITPEYKDDNL